MLVSFTKRWIDWPEPPAKDQPQAAVLLSPMGNTQRAAYLEQATKVVGKGKAARPELDMPLYQRLVAEHHVHDWRGFQCDDGPGTPARPLAFSEGNRLAMMDVEAFNVFVFREITTMAIRPAEEKREVEDAGNA